MLIGDKTGTPYPRGRDHGTRVLSPRPARAPVPKSLSCKTDRTNRSNTNCKNLYPIATKVPTGKRPLCSCSSTYKTRGKKRAHTNSNSTRWLPESGGEPQCPRKVLHMLRVLRTDPPRQIPDISTLGTNAESVTYIDQVPNPKFQRAHTMFNPSRCAKPSLRHLIKARAASTGSGSRLHCPQRKVHSMRTALSSIATNDMLAMPALHKKWLRRPLGV